MTPCRCNRPWPTLSLKRNQRFRACRLRFDTPPKASIFPCKVGVTRSDHVYVASRDKSFRGSGNSRTSTPSTKPPPLPRLSRSLFVTVWHLFMPASSNPISAEPASPFASVALVPRCMYRRRSCARLNQKEIWEAAKSWCSRCLKFESFPKRWRLFNNSGEHSWRRVSPARCKLDRTQGGDEQASC
jgi:hypothetical protein